MDANPNRQLTKKFQSLIEDHWLMPIRKARGDPTDQWHQSMGKAGLRCPTWPSHLGGSDYTHADATTWWAMCASNDCPFPDPVATELIGPLLLQTNDSTLHFERLRNIALGIDRWQVVLLSDQDLEIRTINTETNPNRVLVIEANVMGQSTFSLCPPWQGLDKNQPPGPEICEDREVLDLDLPKALERLGRDHQPLTAIWRNRSLLKSIALETSASQSEWADRELALLNIAQSALETLCLRLSQTERTQKLNVVTLRARKIRSGAQGLRQQLMGYYALTEARQPGANQPGPYRAQPGDAMTMIEAFLEPDFVFNLITGATGTQAAQTGPKVERSKIGFAALTNNQPSQPNDV